MTTEQKATPLSVEDVMAAVRKVGGQRLSREDALTDDVQIADLGFDSLDLAEIIVTLEETAGCQLDVESVERSTTIADLVSIRPL